MSFWGDGRDYENDSRYLRFSAREFVRRLRYAITKQENRFVWFLGAGCSVTSGVPTAKEIVLRWIKELKYLQTGSESGIEEWGRKQFLRYDPDDPAAIYAEVFDALFFNDADRRRELEELMEHAEPGFGYATLAQLMTHEKWGVRANFAISTNFDDLCADALHLYSRRRPQVYTNESLGRRTPLSPTTPTIVKVHGDAHLTRPDDGNRITLAEAVKERLREQIAEAGLIFIGYGGRDDSVLELLEGLPPGAPAGGLFWINEEPPKGGLAEWAERRRTIWVRHSDFDELMYFARLEFGLGHPKVDRFERALRRYDVQYRELSTRAGIALPDTPAQPDAGDAPEPSAGAASAPGRRLSLRGAGSIGARKETPDSRRERLRQSLHLFSKAIRSEPPGDPSDQGGDGFPGAEPATPATRSGAKAKLLDAAKLELRGAGKAHGTAGAVSDPSADPSADAPRDPSPAAAPERPAPSALGDRSTKLGEVLSQLDGGASGASGGSEGPVAPPEPDRLAPRALGAAKGQGKDIARYARAFEGALSKRSAQRAQFPVVWSAASAGGARLPAQPIGPASPEEARQADAALVAAIEKAADPGPLMARRARFLAIAARDLAAAEEVYEAAQQSAPDDIPLLRDYAKFAVEQLRDAPRAERLLTRALNLDLRNADTLRALADYLIRARGDLDEADNCYRLAIELAPEDAGCRIAYARFLEEIRCRRDAAEPHLRAAADIRPISPDAQAELALFRLRAGVGVEHASSMLEDAQQAAPGAPMLAYARAALAERRGDLDMAEAEYQRAVEAAPRLFRAQRAYAAFLRNRRGEVKAAEAQLRLAAGAAPDEGEPLSALAAFLEDQGTEPREVERLHRDAVEREPYNAKVRAAYAAFLGRQADRVEEADALFQDALSLTPRDSQTLRAYGRFLAEKKRDADAAETYLRRAVDYEPGEIDALNDLAQFLHDVREDAEQAEVYFREAVRLAPNRAETLNNFAAFLRDTQRSLDEAARCYRQAAAQNPKDAVVLSRAAQFLLSEGRTDEGLKVLNDAFDAAYSMDPAARPRWLMLELWIYRYAHDTSRRDDSARAAMVLIDAGARSEGWDLGPTVERAIEAGHPDPEFLRDLARVATDGADPDILKRDKG